MKQIHNIQQGSPSWHEYRAKHCNASDASAMLGFSKYKSRSNLLREVATGVTQEHDAATLARFAKGHEFEAIARVWAEEIAEVEFFPAVMSDDVDGLPLSASFDGIDMAENVTFEHKSGNVSLFASLDRGEIPGEYKPQLEQGLLISGATKCLFMASSGDMEGMRYAWYESDPQVRADLIAGWKQFRADVAAYQHVEEKPPVVVEPVEALPVPRVTVSGSLSIISNLDRFGDQLRAFVEKLNPKPESDEDFAVADNAVKALKKAEEALETAETMALSQVVSVEEMRSAVATLKQIARSNRLATEKLVEARKVAIRAEQIERGKAAMQAHMVTVNAAFGQRYITDPAIDFASAIKGRKTVLSLRDAIDTAIANAKIAVAETVTRVQHNLTTLEKLAADHRHLFPDLGAIVVKATDDFESLIRARLAQHEERIRLEREKAELAAQEAAEREREKIAAQERAKIEAEQRAAIIQPQPVAQVIVKSEPPAKLDFYDPASVSLGKISAWLGFTVTADFLARLGFDAVQVKNAKLYRPSNLPLIRDAIIAHLGDLIEYREAA